MTTEVLLKKEADRTSTGSPLDYIIFHCFMWGMQTSMITPQWPLCWLLVNSQGLFHKLGKERTCMVIWGFVLLQINKREETKLQVNANLEETAW